MSLAYSGSQTGLTIFWLEVLEMAHASDDAAVAQRLATLQLRRDDLDELFGKGAAQRLWPEYVRAFGSFAGEGAAEIARKIRERRYDDVEVLSLNGRASELPPAERRTADRSAPPPGLHGPAEAERGDRRDPIDTSCSSTAAGARPSRSAASDRLILTFRPGRR